ncbi:MAG: sulfur carrier protein ThiS [Phycisphaerales bacterium]|nr:MAG: sulfur carrier protein ThiS [Phycisphaerales bacterium]
MRVIINGKHETVQEGITVTGLLDRLNLAPVRVAVEINEDIVPRKTFAETTVQEGDRIEIVTFVGGG